MDRYAGDRKVSHARDISGPWLDASVLRRAAQLRREFDLSRDPYIARQLRDLDLTEAQRREAPGDGPEHKQDKPAPALKPTGDIRMYADREGWLTAQRDAAFARIAAKEAKDGPDREPDRVPHRSSPGPSL